jgi:hypothetical protein
MNALFWNINKKYPAERIKNIIRYHKIDLLILAECEEATSTVLKSINENETRFKFIGETSKKIKCFFNSGKGNMAKVNHIYNEMLPLRYTNNKNVVNIFCVHLPSIPNGNKSANVYSEKIAKEVRRIEKETNVFSSIVIGDFNMNPFDIGMVAHHTFNSLMCRDTVLKLANRKLNDNTNSYYYNPMWSFLGDLSPCKPGTYFYSKKSYDNNYLWNMLDQVLINSTFLSNFTLNSVGIIQHDGISDLNIMSNKPYSDSDHYPIFLSINT